MGAFLVYALLRTHAIGALAPAQGAHHSLHGKVLALSIISMLGQYLSKLLLPTHLNAYYFFEATTSVTPLVIVALAAELGIVAAIFLLRGRADRGTPGSAARKAGFAWMAPLISYGLFFILIPLAPVLNVNGLAENAFAERYLYLPSVGFVVVAGAAWEWLAEKQRAVAWTVMAALVAASAWILLPHNLVWHDDHSLFTATAAESPKSATVAASLGSVYLHEGQTDAAIQELQVALKLQPDLAVTILLHKWLGDAYSRQRRYQDSAAELRTAVALNPNDFESHFMLGVALESLGDIPGASAEYQKSVAVRPGAEAYIALALLRMRDKDYPAALDFFQHALALNPRSFDAYINMGVVYNDTGRYAEASVAFRKAIAVQPNNPMAYAAHYNLGLSYSHLRLGTEAAREFSRALQLKPDLTPAREALTQMQNALQPQSAK